MTIASRIPAQHTAEAGGPMFGYYTGPVQRSACPYFAPPVLSGMREPGTNFVTILTATDRSTGLSVGPGSNSSTPPVPPLTHKGG